MKKFAALAALGVLMAIYVMKCMNPPNPPTLDLAPWWADSLPQEDDISIHDFVINVPEEDLNDLKKRLSMFPRLRPPLKNANFTYGFNSDTLLEIRTYWMDRYNWREREKKLNVYPHFKTQIEGLKIHFLRATPNPTEGVEVRPLLLIHGWPGSFVEFYDILPFLTERQEGSKVVFDVIVPSIPGYGFSDASAKPGLGPVEVPQVFLKLMKRLGFQRFYIQGGDLGSSIAANMAILYPENVIGMHSNMAFVIKRWSTFKMILGAFLPTGWLITETNMYPLKDFFSFWLRESGYIHIQATKPDTIGCALNYAPLGLAAYILEKFSTWTHRDNVNLPDGNLFQKSFPISMDKLLDNVCVYWFSQSIVSSMRFYSEGFAPRTVAYGMDEIPVKVPAGVAAFPNEIAISPESLVRDKYQDLVSYVLMPDGGHFAAMEQPALLAKDVHKFVNKVEERFNKDKH